MFLSSLFKRSFGDFRGLILATLALLGPNLGAWADIVGGEDVKEVDPIRRSTIGLYTPSRDGHGGSLCTASIIGKDTAVTAAHCIQPGGPKPIALFGRDLHGSQTDDRKRC